MVTFLIHVMGEEEPRATVCDSEETARRVAAGLGLDRRCYTIVKDDDLGPRVARVCQPLPQLVPVPLGVLEVGEDSERLFPVERTGTRAEHGDGAAELF